MSHDDLYLPHILEHYGHPRNWGRLEGADLSAGADVASCGDELFIDIELARSAVMAAARAVDAGADDAAKLVSLAKARCSDTFVLTTNEGVQMFGGVGMTDEYDIGFYMKRARAAEMTFGDAAHHRQRWARLSGY